MSNIQVFWMLIISQGNKIQRHKDRQFIYKLDKDIQEGSVYYISKFIEPQIMASIVLSDIPTCWIREGSLSPIQFYHTWRVLRTGVWPRLFSR